MSWPPGLSLEREVAEGRETPRALWPGAWGPEPKVPRRPRSSQALGRPEEDAAGGVQISALRRVGASAYSEATGSPGQRLETPGFPGSWLGRARSKREAIKMPRHRPQRKTRPLQISWACGIILINIIDSYCTCENRKKLIPTLNPTNRLELLDGARRGCDLGSDLVLRFSNSVCLALSFIIYVLVVPPGPGWRPSRRLQASEGFHLRSGSGVEGLSLNRPTRLSTM